jgi:hypothetical protein
MPRRSIVAFSIAASAIWSFSGAIATSVLAAAEPSSAEQEAAYTRTITERAEKIVATLGIDDEAKNTRVRDLIAGQYRALREIHDARDARLQDAAKSPGGDPTVAAAWTKVARDQAALKLSDLHRRFVARLSVELTPEQVEGVKNGLTYGVVPITYDGYLKLLPTLTDEQKREILANLIEARELAMDGGSSEEKHTVFGKYKGRINNYLSKQGFDLKAAEKELAAKRKSQP